MTLLSQCEQESAAAESAALTADGAESIWEPKSTAEGEERKALVRSWARRGAPRETRAEEVEELRVRLERTA